MIHSIHNTIWSKTISVLICLLLLCIPIVSMAQSGGDSEKLGSVEIKEIAEQDAVSGGDSEKLGTVEIIIIAEQDAVTDAGDAFGYKAGGFFCGIFGWIFALSSNCQPPAYRMIGKDADYIYVYASAYSKKVKNIRIKAACSGWLLGAAVSLAFNLIMMTSSSSS